jgi:hypothetical protein
MSLIEIKRVERAMWRLMKLVVPLEIQSMSGITKTSQRGQFNYNAGK